MIEEGGYALRAQTEGGARYIIAPLSSFHGTTVTIVRCVWIFRKSASFNKNLARFRIVTHIIKDKCKNMNIKIERKYE